MGKFVIKDAKTGTKFDLFATNGQVICSSQVYKSEKTCREGIASVQRIAAGAGVEDQTVEGFEVLKHPKFEVYQDNAGKFRFRLKATNGQIVAVSQAYVSVENCMVGVESVKANAPEATVVSMTAKVEKPAAAAAAAEAEEAAAQKEDLPKGGKGPVKAVTE